MATAFLEKIKLKKSPKPRPYEEKCVQDFKKIPSEIQKKLLAYLHLSEESMQAVDKESVSACELGRKFEESILVWSSESSVSCAAMWDFFHHMDHLRTSYGEYVHSHSVETKTHIQNEMTNVYKNLLTRKVFEEEDAPPTLDVPITATLMEQEFATDLRELKPIYERPRNNICGLAKEELLGEGHKTRRKGGVEGMVQIITTQWKKLDDTLKDLRTKYTGKASARETDAQDKTIYDEFVNDLEEFQKELGLIETDGFQGMYQCKRMKALYLNILRMMYKYQEKREWVYPGGEAEPGLKRLSGNHWIDAGDVVDPRTEAGPWGLAAKHIESTSLESWMGEVLGPWEEWEKEHLSALSASEATSGYYNELNEFGDSFRYPHHFEIHSAHSLPFDDRSHYQQRIGGEYAGDDVSGSGSPLLIGGVVGASAVVIIMLIFCLGLAFGMIIYWGYSQKRALDAQKKKG
eukprot:186088_1